MFVTNQMGLKQLRILLKILSFPHNSTWPPSSLTLPPIRCTNKGPLFNDLTVRQTATFTEQLAEMQYEKAAKSKNYPTLRGLRRKLICEQKKSRKEGGYFMHASRVTEMTQMELNSSQIDNGIRKE